MAETNIVHIGENSPEHVALQLLRRVAIAENIKLGFGDGGSEKPTREWILSAYADCLTTVRSGMSPSERQRRDQEVRSQINR